MQTEKEKLGKGAIIAIAIFGIFYCFIWFIVLVDIFSLYNPQLKIYFLDVGQGDSELLVLPGGAKILIDGGPDKAVLLALSRVMPFSDRRIDLVVSSHAQLDHFGGLVDVVSRYEVGAFLEGGRDSELPEWQALRKTISKKAVLDVVLRAGDKIKYANATIRVISPDNNLIRSAELNDTVLTLLVDSLGVSSLFAGDLGSPLEDYLAKKENLNIDILKVSHHGSKFSSSLNFLKAISPSVAVIEVGKNRYGHPTKEALNNLKIANARVYRTDKNGTVKVVSNSKKIEIFTEK